MPSGTRRAGHLEEEPGASCSISAPASRPAGSTSWPRPRRRPTYHGGYGDWRPLAKLTNAGTLMPGSPPTPVGRTTVLRFRPCGGWCLYCLKDLKVNTANPIAGVKVDQGGCRVHVLHAGSGGSDYRWVCRTGPSDPLRHPGRHPAALRVRPCRETPCRDRRARATCCSHFPTKEAKVKSKDRYIHIPKSLKPIVEKAVSGRNQGGPLSRKNGHGKPWDY